MWKTWRGGGEEGGQVGEEEQGGAQKLLIMCLASPLLIGRLAALLSSPHCLENYCFVYLYCYLVVVDVVEGAWPHWPLDLSPAGPQLSLAAVAVCQIGRRGLWDGS